MEVLSRVPVFALCCALAYPLHAKIGTCPAGLPVNNLQLQIVRADPSSPIPLREINRIEEGDVIRYVPIVKPKEKKQGKVALVLVAASPSEENKLGFEVLDPEKASEPAEWKVPFRSSLAVFVYGPDGISTGKVRGFLSKDAELISQLADYAEKTTQTETALQALAAYQADGASENLGAALEGFARQYGVNNKIDRNAPLDQQTLSVFRSLNPALATYDPIAPAVSQRVSQTTGLATTVAAMFFGSSVGLAAGGAALGLNLKTLIFPNTEFRSSYAQTAANQSLSLCGKRDPSASRSRIAYLWALRAPNTDAPKISIEEPNHIPLGLRTPIKASMPDRHWPVAQRARQWTLQTPEGIAVPVKVSPVTDQRTLEIDLAKADIKPGRYTLTGYWDWDRFTATGDVYVHELAKFQNVSLDSASRNRLRQRSGKQIVTLQGADFQFVDKVTLVKQGDKYGSPQDVKFSLPIGPRRGPQTNLELQIDAANLDPGDYALMIYQQNANPQPAPVKVLPDPPRVENLPLTIHEGDPEMTFALRGDGLDRITAITADDLTFTLDPADASGHERRVRIAAAKLKRGAARDANLTIKDYGEPVLLPKAVVVAARRPRITAAEVALPAELPISLQPKELPAGMQISAMLRVEGAGSEPTVRLRCTGDDQPTNRGPIKLQAVQSDRLFISFDPGQWPGGCALSAQVESREGAQSMPFPVGQVLTLPRIETFRLTDEPAPEGGYVGILTGRDLELIEKAGWDAKTGYPVLGLPTPVVGDPQRQTVRIRLPWPSPTPHSALFVWFRGEQNGRSTQSRY